MILDGKTPIPPVLGGREEGVSIHPRLWCMYQNFWLLRQIYPKILTEELGLFGFWILRITEHTLHEKQFLITLLVSHRKKILGILILQDTPRT